MGQRYSLFEPFYDSFVVAPFRFMLLLAKGKVPYRIGWIVSISPKITAVCWTEVARRTIVSWNDMHWDSAGLLASHA